MGGVNLLAGLPGVLGESLPADGSGAPRVLIGRDILARYDLNYNGVTGTFSLTGGQQPIASSLPGWVDSVGIAAVGSLLALAFYRKSQRG